MYYKTLTAGLVILFVFFCRYSFADMATDRYGGPRYGYDYELKDLPAYCLPKMRKGKKFANQRKMWKEKFGKLGKRGKDYTHCHHYCQALIGLNRLKQNIGKKKDLIGYIEGNLKYVITHSSPEFVLMPEILQRMIYIQTLKGDQAKVQYYLAYLSKLQKAKKNNSK